MTDTTGLIIQGDDDANKLDAEITRNGDGSANVYNIIRGGGGDDQLSASFSFASFSKQFGMQLFGQDGNDILWGADGRETLSGGSGDDTIHYFGGQDVIDGGHGHDKLGIEAPATLSTSKLSISGIEELDFDADGIVAGDLDLSQFALRDTGWSSKTDDPSAQLVFRHQVNVQGLNFIGRRWHLQGSSAADLFNVSSYKSSFWIEAGAGDDTIQGGDRNDTLLGQKGDDIILGGAGRDWLYDLNGTNTIHGGEGNDTIIAYQKSGWITGDSGNDQFNVRGHGSDEANIVTLDGGNGNDTFVFGDYFHGVGNLLIDGGKGNDTLMVARDTDFSKAHITGIEKLRVRDDAHLTVTAELLGQIQSVDTDLLDITLSRGGSFVWHPRGHLKEYAYIDGSSQDDHMNMANSRMHFTIAGKDGNDRIIGGMGINFLSGDGGDDVLSGHGAEDQLNGGLGDDIILGYGTRDTLNGGAGDDTLVAAGGLAYMHGTDGKDTFAFSDNTGGAIVYDFDPVGGEVLDFSHVSTVKDFHDLMSHHVTTAYGGRVLFITYGTSEIALLNVHTGDLNTDNVHF